MSWQRGCINIVGKGNKRRVIPMSPLVRNLLRDLFSRQDRFPIAIRTIQKYIREVAERARIMKPVSPHVLRQGFEYVRVNDLDGHQRGGFYIKKENSQESNTHFVLKHLFTELHDNIYVEQVFGDRRVDAVFLLEGFKLGIEIETGANREDYLADKIKWLDKNFDSWIFVCP
ncbi:MAG: hypothetical protein ABIG89_02630 [Candidatus Woesearchaeota archaeon]